MASDFLDDYPLGYLLSNKDKTTNFYQLLRNVCLSLTDGQNVSESQLSVSWNTFRLFVFAIGINLGAKRWQIICEIFIESFHHSNESPDDFLAWHFSDLINESIYADWGQIDNLKTIPIDLSSLNTLKKTRKSKSADKRIKLFFEQFVNEGIKFTEIPSHNDLKVFAQKTLPLIEDPKIKETLTKISFGRFKEWLPVELQQTLDNIGRLTLKDGRMLIAAKPLLENWETAYAIKGKGQTGEIKEPPKPPEPKRKGGKINLWLDWYHSMLDNGQKCTLEDVARKSGYSLGYIKQRHMVYKAKPNQNT